MRDKQECANIVKLDDGLYQYDIQEKHYYATFGYQKYWQPYKEKSVIDEAREYFENKIRDNNYRGISIGTFSENSTIYSNTIIDNTLSSGYGIEIRSNNNKIHQNILDNNKKGIYAYDCVNNTIHNNTISNHLEEGVWLENANKTKIIDNKIEDNPDIGVYVESSENKIYSKLNHIFMKF